MATRAIPQARSRGRLSRERILRAAIARADAGGLEALTMRTLDDELEVSSAAYSEIASVSTADPGGVFQDAQIVVATTAGDEIVLLASTEDKGHDRFLSELESRRQAAAK